MMTAPAVLFGLDVALVLMGWPLILLLCRPELLAMFMPPSDLRAYLYPAADMLLLFAMGMYRRDAMVDTNRSLSRVPLVVGMGTVLAVTLSAVLPVLMPAVFAIPAGRDQAVVLALAIGCFTAAAFIARLMLSVLLRHRVLRRRLLVIGAGRRAWDLLQMLTKEGSNLNYELTFLHDDTLGELDSRLANDTAGRIIRAEGFGVLGAARDQAADQIIIAPDERRGMNLERLLDCKKAGFPVVQYLSFVEKEIRRVDLKRMELSWLLYSEGFTFGVIDRVVKRGFDLLVSSVVLLLTAPLILAGIIAIRWEGRGPVFYRQERVTRDGRVFSIMKLRTMRVDAERQGAVWAATSDSRITTVGHFLRRTRIDELPQLVNILLGDMSFVGPRPERPMFVDELATKIPLYHERHMVKAGLTGWAQSITPTAHQSTMRGPN